MIRICVAGATGRMGKVVLKEASETQLSIVGAIAADNDPQTGMSLKEAGICNSNIVINKPSNIRDSVRNADVYVSFTSPQAESTNLPIVASLGKKIISGTTGLTEIQMKQLSKIIAEKVPAVFSPNYALGINVFFSLIENLASLPLSYDFSISEIHHTGKKDAPSGTARKLADIVKQSRNYSKIIYGREGISPRVSNELEVVSMRSGGIPGIHDLIIAGPYEMLKIEHVAFSRSVFAQGALYATKWIYEKTQPGIYSMKDVLR